MEANEVINLLIRAKAILSRPTTSAVFLDAMANIDKVILGAALSADSDIHCPEPPWESRLSKELVLCKVSDSPIDNDDVETTVRWIEGYSPSNRGHNSYPYLSLHNVLYKYAIPVEPMTTRDKL